MKTALLTCCLVALSASTTAFGESTSADRDDQIRAEIESVDAREQEAFVTGDCEAVASFYARDVTFYANGSIIPSVAALVSLCERIARPFEQPTARRDSIHVLSETTAYLVTVMEFPPQDEAMDRLRREVVTKVWSKGPEGWKIVHFHSSISVVPQ